MTFNEIVEMLRDVNALGVALRFALALLCGGIIGLERESKRRSAGFFECALMAFAAIILSTTLLDKVEKLITSRSRNMNINIMVTETSVISDVHEVLRGMNLKIFDSEITNVRELANESPNVVIESKLTRRRPHVEIIAALAAIDGVISGEEL